MLSALGHYGIISRLGAGGMGEVYLGTDTRLNRRVAIKVLPPGTSAGDEAERRMLREARMVATIDHPNVCTIYEVATDGEQPYIVMQYIEGETLLERMRRGRIDLPETIRLAGQITSALSEAHARGIVHRDIKPGNIMISTTGVVKVLDFGVAISLASPTGTTQTVASLAMAGTIPYMSPEQLRGEPLDGRSDIFSLGVVLYEMVSSRRPFDRPTTASTIAAILTEDPAPLDSPLAPIVARALARQPSARFPSAAAMQAALEASGTDPARPSRAADHAGPRTTTVTTPVDSETEKLYLRGRAHWNKRHPDAMRQAIACFQEAIERDPLFARGYAALADAYLMLAFLQALSPRDVMPKGKAAARRAIELDPALAEPHASLGYMAGWFDWDPDTAKRELLEAMRLNPQYSWAPHWYGLLVTRYSLDEAMTYVSRARDLDPLSPILSTAVGIPLHMHRRYHEAIRIYASVIESETTFAPAYYYMGLSYEQLGDYESAVGYLTRAGEISGRGTLFIGALGHCLGVSGKAAEARQLLSELEQRSRDRYISPFNVMLIHLGLGEREETLAWLERALAERNAWLWTLPVEARFDPLRETPAFRELVSRYGLVSEP